MHLTISPEQTRQIEVASHEAGHALVGGVLEGRAMKFWTIFPVLSARTRNDLRKGLNCKESDGVVLLGPANGSSLAVNMAGLAGESYENFLPHRVQTRKDVVTVYGKGSDELGAWDEVACFPGSDGRKPSDETVRACLMTQYDRIFSLLCEPLYDRALQTVARYMLERKQEADPNILHRLRSYLGRKGVNSRNMQDMREGLSSLQLPEKAREYIFTASSSQSTKELFA